MSANPLCHSRPEAEAWGEGHKGPDCSSPEASIVRPAPVGAIGVCKAASAAAVTKAAAAVAEAAPAVCKAAAERGCINEAAATIPKAVAAALHWVAVLVPVIAATSKATCMPCFLELSAKQSASVLSAPCEQSEAQLDTYLGRCQVDHSGCIKQDIKHSEGCTSVLHGRG